MRPQWPYLPLSTKYVIIQPNKHYVILHPNTMCFHTIRHVWRLIRHPSLRPVWRWLYKGFNLFIYKYTIQSKSLNNTEYKFYVISSDNSSALMHCVCTIFAEGGIDCFRAIVPSLHIPSVEGAGQPLQYPEDIWWTFWLLVHEIL